MKAQMKSADRLKAEYAVILGEDELRQDILSLKNMATGEQTTIPLGDLSALKFVST
jgi:histidyl-tRNA synthetase